MARPNVDLRLTVDDQCSPAPADGLAAVPVVHREPTGCGKPLDGNGACGCICNRCQRSVTGCTCRCARCDSPLHTRCICPRPDVLTEDDL